MQEMRWINFNMGCIEIYNLCGGGSKKYWINFNMGCIEMFVRHGSITERVGINFNMGCIEIICVWTVPDVCFDKL